MSSGDGTNILGTLLQSSDPSVRLQTCQFIGDLVQDKEYNAELVVQKIPLLKLLNLLRDEDQRVIARATDALARALQRPDFAASIVVVATDQNNVLQLCNRLAQEHHLSSVSALLAAIPIENWLADLRSMHPALMDITILELLKVSEHSNGPVIILETNILRHIPDLISSCSSMRYSMCSLVANLVRYHTCAPEIIPTLCGFLREDKEDVVMRAAYALNKLAEDLTSDGAATLLAGNVLETIPRLLCSDYAEIRYMASCLIWNLVKHKSTHRACSTETCAAHEPVINSVLECLPIGVLWNATRDVDERIVQTSAQTLARLSCWPVGAKALVTLDHLETHLSGLIASPISLVRQATCMILENLALYEFALPKILEVSICETLLSLLYDADVMTRAAAIYALVQISRGPKGASALAELRALEVLHQLEDRDDSWMRNEITTIERNIADGSQ
ncbi:armadillo-type protein [Roridomyces roridus]|uniref:non-specific serine/threonine protein kinase n=1 Tax=Roridomyces roridus TaxID=1738132 RepID=A0AAD7FG93_9AGAR|nr:armadillo-type protein [Roridomyces roridus]